MKRWNRKSLPLLAVVLLLTACAGTGLDQLVRIEVGRDTGEEPDLHDADRMVGRKSNAERGLVSSLVFDRLGRGSFITPAEDEWAAEYLSKLEDGQEISWHNEHHGKIKFGVKKRQPGMWDPNPSSWRIENGETCRSYYVTLLAPLASTRNHEACLENGRWVPRPRR